MTRCLNTLTECWRRTLWQVVLLLFAVPFLIRNLLLPMVADDFSYSFIWNGDDLGNLMDNIGPRERIDSFYDIGKESCEYLGLRLINNLVENISYKYMYGLNVVLIKI